MLGHAPPPLTANGLDIRGGHPAASPEAAPRRQVLRLRAFAEPHAEKSYVKAPTSTGKAGLADKCSHRPLEPEWT
jgi:hypothetical protein